MLLGPVSDESAWFVLLQSLSKSAGLILFLDCVAATSDFSIIFV